MTRSPRLDALKMKGVNPYFDSELESFYCEMLDEVYGMTKIGPYEYETSRALAAIDPTAFRCGFADWLSSECEERFIEIDGEYFDRETVENNEDDESEGTK